MSILKKLTVYMALALLPFMVQAQQDKLLIVYIDNSNPSSNDRLKSSQLEGLENLVAEIKSANSDFIMYLSDGSDSRIVSTQSSMDRLMDALDDGNTAKPDDYRDVERMRELVYDKLNGSSYKTLEFNFWVTDYFCENFSSGVSPLVHLFPGELRDLFSLEVMVKMHCPTRSDHKGKTVDHLKRSGLAGSETIDYKVYDYE